MDDDVVAEGARVLSEAERTRIPTKPLTEQFPGLTVDEAYAIQLRNVEERLASGRILRGHKVGLTSLAMQEMLGVGEPDYGHLLDDMLFADGAAVPAERFLQPRVEVEIAFRIGAPLAGPGVTAEDVLLVTDSIAPAIEIIDSRITDWKITLADTIADNASSAGVVIGAWTSTSNVPSLDAVPATLIVNGSVVARGTGADVLGHPAAAVAWLANKLASLDIRILAGQIVMPGSCTRAIDVRVGDRVEASFSGLGSVRADFA